MDQEQKRRERLYKTFKHNVTQGNTQSEFDENDLIDIYDYANDVNDEFIQLEVILNAVRYFPESNDLAQRRAYFLLDNLSMSEGAEMMARQHAQESALWDILTLLVKRPEQAEAKKGFNEILQRYANYDDETIIQFVGASSELGLYDWLWENKDEILKRCEYPDTFLYELSQEAYERGDFRKSADALDELTTTEAFNASYWHMLAQAYVHLDNYEEALQAIEYALAIDPSSTDVLITKAQILFDMKKDREEALAIVRGVLSTNPDNTIACHTLVAMDLILGNVDEAQEVLASFLATHPADTEAVEHSMYLPDPAFSILYLKKYLRTTGLDESEWMAWAKSCYERGEYRQCSDILLAWLYENETLPEWSQLVESLYHQSRLAELIAVYHNYISDKNVTLGPLEAYLLMSALFETKDVKESLIVAERITKFDLSEMPRMDMRLMAVGAMERASKLVALVNSSVK